MNAKGMLAGLAALGVFAVLGFALPAWIVFLVTIALAKGLVVLGVALLMRGGLVSFGQGLFFAAGAYAVGFAMRLGWVRETLILMLLGVLAAMVLAGLVGSLVARYRDIFFSMLTLAFSMAFYGFLVKGYRITGGTDGLRIQNPTLLGLQLPQEIFSVAVYFLTLASVAATVYLTYRFVNSPLGYSVTAIRENELRVGYLGGSVHRAILVTFMLAAGLAGLGGALQALAVGHIDPALAYWTTSGEFVFIALLSGIGSVFAPLGGAILIELIKTYANKYSPYTWQMVLGVIMLLIVLFLPGGLYTLYERVRRGVRV